MGNKTLVYKQKKVIDNLNESYKHLLRLENAFEALKKNYLFPISMENFKAISDSILKLVKEENRRNRLCRFIKWYLIISI